jgi:hypothetical protein
VERIWDRLTLVPGEVVESSTRDEMQVQSVIHKIAGERAGSNGASRDIRDRANCKERPRTMVSVRGGEDQDGLKIGCQFKAKKEGKK